MRTLRLGTALAATALAVAACGTADSSASSGRPAGGAGPSTTGAPPSAPPASGSPSPRFVAAQALARVQVPADARPSPRAPGRGLAHVPELPSLASRPTVVSRFWTVDRPVAEVYAWLGGHDGALGPVVTVAGASSGSADMPVDPVWPTARYRTYEVSAAPLTAVAHVYVGVAAIGPRTSGIAAYALTLAQPPRPVSEAVPLEGVRVVIGWSLAPGGTPVRKPLTGAEAVRLARDYDALRVSTKGAVPCPLIAEGAGNDVTLTFSAGGHTWVADIQLCPNITVTRDGRRLPALDYGQPFLRDVRSYTGHLPWDGPAAGTGPLTPLVVTPSSR